MAGWKTGWNNRVRTGIWVAAGALTGAAWSQSLLPPTSSGLVRIHNTDMAVLEAREDRQGGEAQEARR